MSKVQCPCCPLQCRKDVLLRHCNTHKEKASSLMTKQHIQYCLKNKQPLFIPPDKSLVMCCVCGKGVVGNEKYSTMFSRMATEHSECLKQFDTIKHIYESTDIDLTDESSAKLLELQKKYDELKHEYDTMDNSFNKYCDDSNDTIAKLNGQRKALVNSTTNLIQLIQNHITDPYTLKLLETEISNCHASMSDDKS